MDIEYLLGELKKASDIIDHVEHKLPYAYEQHDDGQQFLAQIRQRLYSTRCSLGSIRETLKDNRNYDNNVAD